MKTSILSTVSRLKIINVFWTAGMVVSAVSSVQASPVIYGPYKINFEYATSYYHYDEKIYNSDTGAKEDFMRLTSSPFVYGVTCDIRRYIKNNWYAESLVNVVLGRVDYSSAYSGESEGEQNVIFMLDNSINNCISQTVCTSIGYTFRYLDNDSSSTVTSTGNSGYQRENFLHLVPIGIKYSRNLYHHRYSSVQVRSKFYHLLDGRQVSHLSRYGCSDLKNKQNEGYGYEGSVRVYAADKKWFYGASFQYWKIKASDIVSVPCGADTTIGSEPENSTIMAGIMIGYHYI